MGGKAVTELAGVGDTLGKRLEDRGYAKSSAVLGQYLAMNKDEQKFGSWMKDTCGANTKQSSDCYKSLSEWSNSFL